MKHFPDNMQKVVDNGEFDDVLDEFSARTTGTLLDDPLVYAGARILSVYEESYKQQQREEAQEYQKEEVERKERQQQTVTKLKRSRRQFGKRRNWARREETEPDNTEEEDEEEEKEEKEDSDSDSAFFGDLPEPDKSVYGGSQKKSE